MVEENVGTTVEALKNQDKKKAKEVIKKDGAVDLKEVEVEEDCLKILALHQPVAIDLRFVVGSLKINNSLERVSDLAVNISQSVLFLCSCDHQVEAPFDYELMAAKVQHMLKDAINSFVAMDEKKAKEVWLMDDEVDSMHTKVYETVYEKVRGDYENAPQYIHYIGISKNLERIADYATNICQDVIYMASGEITRHTGGDF